MDARTLLAELDELGVTMTQRDGKPRLRFPPGTTAERKRVLLTAVLAHRDHVIRHYQGSAAEAEHCDAPGVQCEECRAWVYGGDDAAGVWACCRRVMCPWWQPGVGPEWVAKERNREEYRRRCGR